jgi:1,4-alpha-glucan branching enzyme
MRATFAVPEAGLDGHVVAVVGDFNGWDPTAAPMQKQGDRRTATLTLQTGRRYAFRYLCDDGAWFNDEAADAYEPNDFGVDNSILDLSGSD